MSNNKRQLSKDTRDANATVRKPQPFSKDVRFDPMGQWKYPGEITKIPSGNITMKNVPYPVYGEDEHGNSQMMYPGQNYQFPGNVVTEYPQLQTGGSMPFDLPLKSANPYTMAQYKNQPQANGYILPDPQRPKLEDQNVTEYKTSYNTGTPDEISIPTIVNGQWMNSRDALNQYRATGDKFKPMADPSSYSKFYDTIDSLGIMQSPDSSEYKMGGSFDELELDDDEIDYYKSLGYRIEEIQ